CKWCQFRVWRMGSRQFQYADLTFRLALLQWSTAMALASFGYFGVHSDKLSDWENYGRNLLGLELVDKTATTLKFRMDDRKQRIIVSSEPEILDTFGWEVNSPGELEEIAARVEAARIPVNRVSAADADLRAVT